MTYYYIKALHIIFIVTWFAGLFYMPRLFIYNREAQDKPEPERIVLQAQLTIMIKRLWYIITWPSAVLTLILGCSTWYIMHSLPKWLMIKLIFVIALYAYHFSLQVMTSQQVKGIFKYSSQQLRLWNEVSTIILVAIVMLAVVKDSLSFVWAIIGFVLLIVVLMAAIKIYKLIRDRKQG